MTSSWSMSETMCISREHFGHRSESTSHTFLINSRHFLEGMRRGSWVETSITSTASPSVCTSSSVCFPRRPRILLQYHPVIAHELEALVGNVLGDRGDKVARGEDLEVARDLLVHAGAGEDRSGCRSRARLGVPGRARTQARPLKATSDGGRPTTLNAYCEDVAKLRAQGRSGRAIAKELGIPAGSVFKLIGEVKAKASV
jgi:hypothetical protein